MEYPDSRRSDVVETLHGRPVADPYRWLEDPDVPETDSPASRPCGPSYAGRGPGHAAGHGMGGPS